MKNEPSLRHPQSFINGLEKTNEYLGYLAKGKGRLASIGQAATLHHERMKNAEAQNLENQLDRSALRIISTLPRFVAAQHALDKIRDDERKRGHKFPRSVRLPHLKAVIPYNHALRDLVDSFPGVDAASIKRFSATAMLDLGSPSEAAYCSERTREALYGMQHEIGLEQILWQIEEVEDVQHATEEQELSGIDLVVTFRDRTLYLDSKASEFGQKSALASREAYMHDRGMSETENTSGYPIWTGLQDDDFKGGFRIDNETAQAQAPGIKAILDELYRQKYAAA